MTQDNAEPSAASAGYANQKERTMEDPLKTIIDEVNEVSRWHTLNYAGLLYALLDKGIVSQEDVEAGRNRATPIIKKKFEASPELKGLSRLAELVQCLVIRKA